MAKKTKTDIVKANMIEALTKSMGVVTTACKKVGIVRSTYYQWYKEDKEFAEKVDGISEIALDFAESFLHKNIEKGKEASIFFYLKCKGKDRGYKESIDHNITQIEVTKRIVDGSDTKG